MAFGKGRNYLEAKIQDEEVLLSSFIDGFEKYFESQISKVEQQIIEVEEEFRMDGPEVMSSASNSLREIIYYYEENFQVIMEMILSRIYSYLEKNMEELMNCRLNVDRRQAKKEYKGVKGLSDVEIYFLTFKQMLQFEESLEHFCPEFRSYHSDRVAIEHHKRENIKDLNVSYIKTFLESAFELLSFVETKSRAFAEGQV